MAKGINQWERKYKALCYDVQSTLKNKTLSDKEKMNIVYDLTLKK